MPIMYNSMPDGKKKILNYTAPNEYNCAIRGVNQKPIICVANNKRPLFEGGDSRLPGKDGSGSRFAIGPTNK